MNVVSYRFNHLSYTDNAFSGKKHELNSKISLKKTLFSLNSSFLDNTSTVEDNSFSQSKGNS